MTVRKYPKIEEISALLNERVLISSTITKSSDEYIKTAVSEFLIQYFALKTGLVTVNNDAKALEQSMLLASLTSEDFTMLLNGSLKELKDCAGTASVTNAETKDIKKEKERELNEQLSKISCETIIENTKQTLGNVRVFVNSPGYASALQSKGYKVGTVVNDSFAKLNTKSMLYIRKPAEIDYSQLLLNNTSGLNLWILFDCITKYESGFLDVLAIPEDVLPYEFKKLFKRIELWAKTAIDLAHTSAHNTSTFTPVANPFAALFDGL